MDSSNTCYLTPHGTTYPHVLVWTCLSSQVLDPGLLAQQIHANLANTRHTTLCASADPLHSISSARAPVTADQYKPCQHFMSCPDSLLRTCPLWYALGQNPSKAALQDWQCASSPDKGQHTPKQLLPHGKGKIMPHTSLWPKRYAGGRHRVWLQAPSTTKAPHRTRQIKCPAVRCYYIFGKCLIWFNSSQGPDGPLTT